MQKVRIVTHSGCDLPPDLAREYDITVLPDLVCFGSEQYRNNVDIHPAEFYARIQQEEIFPTSAHPSLTEFTEAFRAAREYDEVLCIVMSSKMTGTVNTATIAAQMMEEEDFPARIRVYDSLQVSFGMGRIVLEAARMAKAGMDMDSICTALDALVPRIGVYFVMQSLKYAHKGGRIGAIKAVSADALGVKPLLRFRDGTVSDITVSRRFSDGIKSVFKKYQNLCGDDPEVFIFHANNPEDAGKLQQMILAHNPAAQVRVCLVGPVVGIYTGVGCVGISFKEKKQKS